MAMLRRHWLIAVLLAAGLVLRILVAVAYRPALIYVDTLKYLYGASPGSEPLGYHLILKVILVVGDLPAVVAIQHLLGLAMGVMLYVVLLRRGVLRWVAALTAAPVLLDAYELQMEQLIMPDVWFEALVVAGVAVLLWRPVVTVRFAAVAGGDPRRVGDRHAAGRAARRARGDLPARGRARLAPVVDHVRGAGRGVPGRRPGLLRFLVRPHRAFLAGPPAAPGRPAGGVGGLRHAEAARQRAGDRPDAGPAGARAGLAGAFGPVAAGPQFPPEGHERRGDLGPQQRRAAPTAVPGGGLHPPGLGPPVCPDPRAGARYHADRALAVPDRLPDLSALGQRVPRRFVRSGKLPGGAASGAATGRADHRPAGPAERHDRRRRPSASCSGPSTPAC
jgi:hypothetical protein